MVSWGVVGVFVFWCGFWVVLRTNLVFCELGHCFLCLLCFRGFWGVVVGLFWVGFGFWCGGLVFFLGVWCALRLSPARIPVRVFFWGAAGFAAAGFAVLGLSWPPAVVLSVSSSVGRVAVLLLSSAVLSGSCSSAFSCSCSAVSAVGFGGVVAVGGSLGAFGGGVLVAFGDMRGQGHWCVMLVWWVWFFVCLLCMVQVCWGCVNFWVVWCLSCGGCVSHGLYVFCFWCMVVVYVVDKGRPLCWLF